MISTDEGINSEVSDGHLENADPSISEIWLPGPNKTVARRSQSEKQNREIVSSEAGRQSDVSDEQPRNADSSRKEILLSGSKITLERPVQ
jgi:hypothetical protein